MYETTEIDGIIFAWWGIGGRPPQWRLPEDTEVDGGDWSDVAFETIRFPGHPQETTENSGGLAHLRYVHGFDNVKRMESLKIDGPYLRSHFEFTQTQNVAEMKIFFDVSARADIYGIGFSRVTLHEGSTDKHIKLYVLSTPVDGEYVDMVLATQIKQLRKSKRAIVGMGFLPLSLRTSLMGRLVRECHFTRKR